MRYNLAYICFRIKELGINDFILSQFNLNLNSIYNNLAQQNYAQDFIEKLSLILKCNVDNLFFPID